jgi:hypothetical protein
MEMTLLLVQVKEIQEEVAIQLLVEAEKPLVMLLVEAVEVLVEAAVVEQVSKVETAVQALSGQLVLETTTLVVELDMEYLVHLEQVVQVEVEPQILLEQ